MNIRYVVPSLSLLFSLMAAPWAWADSTPNNRASELSRAAFQSIGCKDQTELLKQISHSIVNDGLLNSLGIEEFSQVAQPSLTQWCQKQVRPRASQRAKTLLYCRKTFGEKFKLFLTQVYTKTAVGSEPVFNVAAFSNRVISPQCKMTPSDRKTLSTPAVISARSASKPVGVLPQVPGKKEAPVVRLQDSTEKLFGASENFHGFYANHFRNKMCPAWKKYVDQITNPAGPLKSSAQQKCGLPNKTTLDVIGAIAPQGGYQMSGTGVNLVIQLGSARTYGFGQSQNGKIICGHGDAACLQKNPKAGILPSYCSGAAFSVLMRTINVLSPDIFSQMSPKQLDNFKPGLADNKGFYGLVNNSGNGVQDAAQSMAKHGPQFSFAKIVNSSKRENPFEESCAGDYMQWDRLRKQDIPSKNFVNGFKADGSGHSGVFLGVEKSEDGQAMAYFWSSNGSTRGYGVSCEPVAHMNPKIVRLTKPQKLVHIPEYRQQTYLEGPVMNADLLDNKLAGL